MSYQVLARKWRPRRFSEMVGQQHVLKALENALNQNRLHHAYLFTGTRGVGKTTIARIFAKCLNCERGVSAEPCGQCSVCLAVDEGRFLDLMEIDAASHTGVDAIRELLDNTQYTPTQGQYKVYLIDEVHMLSGSAFNALLKTLEEPPEHVKFLLATTDPQKLPVTVLSRCLQFNLKAMSSEQILEHLKSLLDKEMIRFEEDALALISKAADGSMRDALSLTDQAIAHGNESLKADEVRQMLGLVDRQYVVGILESLLHRDAEALLATVARLAQDSPNYRSVLAELLEQIHDLIIVQVTGLASDAKVKELAAQFTAEELQLYYQVALKGRADLALAPDLRQGMEICLLRMLLFRPEKLVTPGTDMDRGASGDTSSSSRDSKAHFDALKQQLQKKKPEYRSSVELSETPSSRDDDKLHQKAKAVTGSSGSFESETESHDLEQIAPSTDKPVLQKGEQQRQGSDGVGVSFSYGSIPDKWTQIVLTLDNLSGPALQVVNNSNFEKVGGKRFKLTFDSKYEMLATELAKSQIREALSKYFAQDIELDVVSGSLQKPSPSQLFQSLDLEKSRYAEESILEDDTVKVFLDEFDAKVIEGSARLRNQ